MDMNISMRDKKILLMFLGVGVLQQDISSDTDRRWKRRRASRHQPNL